MQIARLFAGSGDVKLEFNYEDDSEEQKATWKSNPTTRVITIPRKKYYSETEVGIILHEAAHLRFTNEIRLKKKHVDCLNAFEDIRVNTKLIHTFRGAKKFIDEVISSSYWNIPFGVKFPKHIQYLLGISYLFYGHNEWFIVKDNEAREAILQTKMLLGEISESENTSSLNTFLEEHVYPIYEKLLPPKQQEDESETTNVADPKGKKKGEGGTSIYDFVDAKET